MAVTALNWKKLATVTLAGSAINQMLDGIYTALGASTYYDGSARTPGSGSAWTVARYQNAGTTEAVYAVPPVGALAHKVIFGGAAGAKTPTMASPDTWVVNCVLVGLAKNAGAYNAWDNAAPFTSGQFYGYWRLTSQTTVVRVTVYEAEECLLVRYETSANIGNMCLIGALWDPGSVAATAAESDGRRYGVAVTNNNGVTSNFHEAVQAWLGHGVTVSTAHTMVAGVGAVATFTPCVRNSIVGSGLSSTTFLTNAAGEALGIPIYHQYNTAAPNDQFVGVLRNVYVIKNSISEAVRQTSAGVAVWYCTGYSTAAAGNCVGLEV